MFWRSRKNQELEREIRSDLELEAQEQLDGGLSPEEAIVAARHAFGNVTSLKEEVREMWGWTSVERLGQDLHYAARMFLRNPVFVTIAAVSLALGMGGNAAMFALVSRLLIRPLPYAQSNRLVRITGVYPKAAFKTFREESRTMDIASASPGSEFNLAGRGETVRVKASSVSTNLFSVLEAPVEMGRVFAKNEDQPKADRVMILSYHFWKTRFSGDPNVIGSTVALSGVPREIVGVMPPDFSFPSNNVELWIPATLDPSNADDYWGSEYVPLIGRLRAGAAMGQAQSEVHLMMENFRPLFPFPMPRNWNKDITAIPLQQDVTGEFRGKLWVLFGSSGILLAIACVNVASLLFSRAAVRRKEVALRAALGATRFRIIRQLLTESVLLAVLGAALGLVTGMGALRIFKLVLPPDTSGLSGVGIDWQVAMFAAGLAVITGLAFGIAPALSSSETKLVDSMKSGSGRSMSTKWSRIRSGLIVGEISLTVLLVVSAGLLLKSLYVMSTVNPGFSSKQILTARISPDQSACKQRESCIATYDKLLQETQAITGVSEVAIANTIPMDGMLPAIPVDIEDHPKSADFPAPMFWTGAVSPAYFHLMHIPIVAGRAFSVSDGPKSSGVVIISASTARRFWPNQSPLGKHVKPVWDSDWRTVVGVVSDVHQFSLTGRDPESITGAFYLPYAQSVGPDHQIPAAVNLLVVSNEPMVAYEMRRIARELNPSAPVSEVAQLGGIISQSAAGFQSTIWLFLSFAGVALVLAAVGIYGLVSHSVAQRTYEIGLRVAIGATRPEILKLILGESFRLTLMGIAAGMIASILVTRFLASLLFGVGATDPLTFACVCGLMLAIAAMASYAPAWRAANLDPIKSLRAE